MAQYHMRGKVDEEEPGRTLSIGLYYEIKLYKKVKNGKKFSLENVVFTY